MKKYFIISFFITLLSSCATQKIPNDFENNTIYKLIDEQVLEKKYVKVFKQEKKYVPITAQYFVYHNYDTFYVFSKDGKMKLITLPKDQKSIKEAIVSAKGIEGNYFESKKQKQLKYKQYNLTEKRIINKKGTYQLSKDSLWITIDDYSYQFSKCKMKLIKLEE